jgi:PAS domain S-box-containing protein
MNEIEEIKKILERERQARKEAERILEQKSLEIYNKSLEIEQLRSSLKEQAEMELAILNKKQKVLNELFENHPFAIIIYSLDNQKILEVNSTCQSIFGYTRDEFLGLTIHDLHTASEKKRLKNYISNSFQINTTNGEWKMIKKDHNTISTKITGSTTVYKGKPARVIIVEDITDHKDLVDRNQKQQKKYQTLIEKSSDLIYTVNRGGYFTYMNPTGLDTIEYDYDELIKLNFKELIREDYRDRVASFYKFQYESKTPSTYTEFPIVSKSGKIIWLGQNVDMKFEDGSIEISTIARDITEKKIFEKELLRNEEKYKSVINNLQLGLLEVDNAGVIKSAHPSFCKMVGYTKEEIEGTTGEFMLDEQGKNIMLEQRKNRTKGITGVYEFQLITKSGDPIWVMISGAPTFDENNKPTGSIGIHLNITDQKKLEKELRESAFIAEESLKAKELFLANISHEIRTPLNGIIGLSELLAEGELSDVQRLKTDSILVSSKNLLALIDDLLLLTKIENKKIEIHPVSIDFKNAIEDLVRTHQLSSSKKGLELRSINEIDRNYYYYVDINRMNQILNNLISNAIKFTDKGSVEVHSRITYNSRDYDAIEIEIRDSGMGIPQDEIDKIFGSFQQASNNNTNANGGTGLGLSIVQELVSLMNGRIDLITSEKGSSFFLEFELKKSKKPVEHEKKLDVKASLKGLRVLVAEDNEVNQFLIKSILDKWLIESTICSNGLEAVNHCEKDSFDIILMDLRMPVMEGSEAMMLIRKQQPEIPIIAVTANSTNADIKTYLNQGFTDMLSKPFVQKDLQFILKQYTSDEICEIEKQLLEITGGDKMFALQLATIFHEDSTKRCNSLSVAIENRDIDTINSICHSMKPSVLQLGCSKSKKLVLELEDAVSLNSATMKSTKEFIQVIEEMSQTIINKIVPNLENLTQKGINN